MTDDIVVFDSRSAGIIAETVGEYRLNRKNISPAQGKKNPHSYPRTMKLCTELRAGFEAIAVPVNWDEDVQDFVHYSTTTEKVIAGPSDRTNWGVGSIVTVVLNPAVGNMVISGGVYGAMPAFSDGDPLGYSPYEIVAFIEGGSGSFPGTAQVTSIISSYYDISYTAGTGGQAIRYGFLPGKIPKTLQVDPRSFLQYQGRPSRIEYLQHTAILPITSRGPAWAAFDEDISYLPDALQSNTFSFAGPLPNYRKLKRSISYIPLYWYQRVYDDPETPTEYWAIYDQWWQDGDWKGSGDNYFTHPFGLLNNSYWWYYQWNGYPPPLSYYNDPDFNPSVLPSSTIPQKFGSTISLIKLYGYIAWEYGWPILDQSYDDEGDRIVLVAGPDSDLVYRSRVIKVDESPF